MQKVDTAELRRLWEEKEASPSGLDAGLSDAECAWMDAVDQSFPALLDELEAAREQLESVRHLRLIGTADELETWAEFFGGIKAIQPAPKFWQGKEEGFATAAKKLKERAAQLRQEAEGK